MPLILPPPSEQTNDSEREPHGLRPAHTRGEAAARLFVGSFALPMERERGQSRWRVGRLRLMLIVVCCVVVYCVVLAYGMVLFTHL